MKLVRVLRLVRVLHIFRQLRILLYSIAHSASALVWSMFLLHIIQVIASIFMAQSLPVWSRDENNELDDRRKVYAYFVTFIRALSTMFDITLAPGAWDNIGRMIIYGVDRWHSLFFFLYVSCVTFAVMQVFSAIFLKETLAAAQNVKEMAVA